MSNQEQITKLAELAQSCHQIERNFKELPFFAQLPYATVPIDRAVHHIEHARMYAGDLLRLAVLKADHRKSQFFDVSAYGGRFTGVIQTFENSTELVKWAKRELRALFYIICDEWAKSTNGYFSWDTSTSFVEWDNYGIGLKQSLKQADQCLGLWLGEIHEQEKKAPPSNAKEVPTFPEGGLQQKEGGEVLFSIDKLRKLGLPDFTGGGIVLPPPAPSLFNAIMADLDEPEINVFNNDVLVEDKCLFTKKQIEQVLRKHLGLPIVNPKS